MDNVSQEIIDIIVQNLDQPYSRYAPVSHAFQQAIEQRTFEEVDIESTESGLEFFDQLFASAHRRRHVRSLSYLVVLPQVSKERLLKFQSDEEAAENNRVWTKAITDLFQRLTKWNHDGRSGETLQLNLAAETPPIDDEVLEELEEEIEDMNDAVGFDLPISETRDVGRLLQFEPNLVLPIITAVTLLDLGSKQQLRPEVLTPLVAALPELEGLRIFHLPPPRRMHDLRKDLFQSMGEVFQELSLSNLEELYIQYRDSPPLNERFNPSSLLESADQRDAFSLIFQKTSRLPHLKTLNLREHCCIQPTFFSLPSSSTPFFAALRDFEIQISAVSASGRWYTTGDPSSAILSEHHDEEPSSDLESDSNSEDSGSEASDPSSSLEHAPKRTWSRLNGDHPAAYFRSKPDSAMVTPLALGFVDFARKVPTLEIALLQIGDPSGAGMLSLKYYAANHTPGFIPFRQCAVPEKEFLEKYKAVERWIIGMYISEEEQNFEPRWDVSEELVRAMKGEHGDGRVMKSIIPTKYVEL